MEYAKLIKSQYVGYSTHPPINPVPGSIFVEIDTGKFKITTNQGLLEIGAEPIPLNGYKSTGEAGDALKIEIGDYDQVGKGTNITINEDSDGINFTANFIQSFADNFIVEASTRIELVSEGDFLLKADESIGLQAESYKVNLFLYNLTDSCEYTFPDKDGQLLTSDSILGFYVINNFEADYTLVIGDNDDLGSGTKMRLADGDGEISFTADDFSIAASNIRLFSTGQVRLLNNNVSSTIIMQFPSNSGTFATTNDIGYDKTGYTVATLPTGTIGDRAYVTDSTVIASGNFGATVAGTGGNVVPVFYDGTNWIIA